MSVGVVNKSTGDRIPTAGMPAIDDALSLISTNPVQNAIITAALADKQDKTDNNLQTTDKTVVGAVNELKSGLTNLIHLYVLGETTTNEYGVVETTIPKTYTVMCARFGDKFVNMFTSPQRQNWAAFVFDLDSSGNCVKSAGVTGYLAVHYIAQTAVLDS